MKPEGSEIATLIIKYLREELTDEEKVELWKWLDKSPKNREFLESRLSQERVRSRLNILAEKDEKGIWKNLKRLIRSTSSFNRLSVWVIYAAAAAIAGIISTFGYMKYHLSAIDEGRPSLATVQHDVAPGKDKAILTLGDGRRIVLDSVQNGDLGEQGAAGVMKMDSNRLVYNNQRSTSAGKEISHDVLTTPNAAQFQVKLPDGTMVWLNNASSIKYPTSFASLSSRKVELTGEAFFEVAKNKSLPFIVSVKNVNVNVLGTSFNIMAYTDEADIKTTLLDGAVRISKESKSVVLKPGEQASSNGQNDRLDVREANVRKVIAWKSGFFSFDNADLKTVMRQLARWYDIDVVYEGTIPDRNFDGGMDRSLNLSQVLKILEHNQVHFKLDGKVLTVSP